MSGQFQYRVNRVWRNSDQGNVAPFRFFYELISFIDSHSGMSWVAYGTGASQTGISVPASWLSWSTVTDPPPYSDQDWCVFQADNASELLDGSGSYQWQCKIQVVNTASTLFQDPSGGSYGLTTEDQLVALRFSPGGGWNSGTLDFSPSGGKDVSDNYACFYEDGIDFSVHFFGDDDVIYFAGMGSATNYLSMRGSYMGMIISRDPHIDDPCFFMVGRISDDSPNSGRRAILAKGTTTSYQFYWQYSVATAAAGWPAFSIARDGTSGLTDYKIDPWGRFWAVAASSFEYTTPASDLVYSIAVAQWETPNHYSIIGELLHIYCSSGSHGQGTLLGNSGYIQMSEGGLSTSYGGIALKRPSTEVPFF
jgi:hypothetical protein